VDGWRLLGRSYLSVGEFSKARQALETALALDENHVPTLAQLAESIAMDQGGELNGEPIPYLQRAQALDPTDEHSLWLISIAYQQAGDHESALAGFDRLAISAQQNPATLETIEQVRRESLEALGLPLNTSPSGLTDAEPTRSSISVSVSVSELTLNEVKSTDAVFIYAKAMNGPPMPLAVSRLKVADLPATVVLDDSMAMVPEMNLAAFPVVMVGARISATGDALAQSGDWYKEQPDVEVGEDASVELVIDQQLP
jgi:cytochrome c-type biogenesis protein CcmH